jgi:hypothetical protein
MAFFYKNWQRKVRALKTYTYDKKNRIHLPDEFIMRSLIKMGEEK